MTTAQARVFVCLLVFCFQKSGGQGTNTTARPKVTINTTKTWINVWKMWATTKGLDDDVLKYNAKELSEHFSRFFAQISRSDGSEYEPDSLRVMLAVLDRNLRQNESKISIEKDREFMVCKQVLE